jgi:hypothetical protein
MGTLGRADEAALLREALGAYCVELMMHRTAHEVRVMRGHLHRAGLL